MKTTPFIFLLAILSSCTGGLSHNHHQVTDWERLNLNGKVKKIIGYNWIAEGKFGDFGKSETDSAEVIFIAHFNEKGFLTEELDFTNFQHKVYTNKNLTERQEMKVYSIGFEKEEKGELLKIHRYIYNDDQQVIKDILLNPSETDSTVRKYEYDSRGNRTLDYAPVFGTILQLEYNDKGQAIKYLAYDNFTDYHSNSNATEGYRKYDEAGNMIEEGHDDFKRIFRYDQDGNMLERTSVHNVNDIRERLFLYKSDEQNNWIFRSKKNNRYLSERVISYF